MRHARLAPLVLAGILVAPLPAPAPTPAVQAGEPSPAYLVGFDDLPYELDDGRWANATVTDLLPALDIARVVPDDPGDFRDEAPHRQGVRYVERDAEVVRPTLTPDDPLYDDQYAPPQVELPTAWDVTLGNTSVLVAVVDTGIEDGHEDLAGAVAAGRDFAEDDDTAQDDCGHGTAVAGTLAARTGNDVGIAGGARVSLLDAKALDPDDDGLCVGALSDVAEAIRWSADEGARVISMSIGSPHDSSALRDAVEYAADQGVVLVGSAGNDGPCTDCVGYPAAYDEVVAVACTDDREEVCDFSSSGREVELAAPGRGVLSTERGDAYGEWSGTSFSAPIVAAVAGLAASAKPDITRDRLRTVLQDTAQDLEPAGRDNASGYGEVDAAEAVTTAAGIDLPPTARLRTSCISLTCTLDASASTDPDTDDEDLSHVWRFGDGVIGHGVNVTHTYEAGGTYPVILAVSDGNTTSHAYTNVTIRLEVRLDAHATQPTYTPFQDPTVRASVERLDTGAGVAGVDVAARTHWSPDHALADGTAGQLEDQLLTAPPLASAMRDAGLLYHRTQAPTGETGGVELAIPGAGGTAASAPTPGHRVVVTVTATVADLAYEDRTTYRVTGPG